MTIEFLHPTRKTSISTSFAASDRQRNTANPEQLPKQPIDA
jgi:hypothetical protein